MSLISTCLSKGLQPLISRPGLFALSLDSIRSMATQKHWNPKWKKFRTLKVVKLNLPDFHEKKKKPVDMNAEELRSYFKELGVQPPRPWREREMFLTCTRSIFEPYVPPEGDGKVSAVSTSGAKQLAELLKKKTTTWSAIRKVRSYDDSFEVYPDFINVAQDAYIKAHTALAENNNDELVKYATEHAYGEMLRGAENKTIRWKFLQSIEPARVVHARCYSAISDDNFFAQITVRFHTQQSLAIYDRFGRLMYGSEVIAKDVLEYVVFEKHICNLYGTWRIHDKIIPDWLPLREPSLKTRIVIPSGPSQEEATPDTADVEVSTPQDSTTTTAVSAPQEKPTVTPQSQ